MPAFDAEVRASGRGSHAVVVPRAVVAELGSRRVVVRIGSESFEATLGMYGGRTFLGLRKATLAALGVAAGATVRVELDAAAPTEEPETEPAPQTCPELAESLDADDAWREAWSRLPEGHQEEYGRWISGGTVGDVRRQRVGRVRHRMIADPSGTAEAGSEGGPA